MDGTLWHLLQTSDSAFPVGGFAHSYGLEGMVQAGLINSPEDLDRFMSETWIPLMAHVDFPLIRLSRENFKNNDDIFRLDQLAWASRTTFESRRAQQLMGQQRIKLVANLTGHHRLVELAQAAADNRWMASWPVVWGVESAALVLPIHDSLIAYGYQSINGILAASMKLIRIGPTEAQKLLHQHGANLKAAIADSWKISEDEIGWFTPLLDITGACHEHAYTRLFIS